MAEIPEHLLRMADEMEAKLADEYDSVTAQAVMDAVTPLWVAFGDAVHAAGVQAGREAAAADIEVIGERRNPRDAVLRLAYQTAADAARGKERANG